MKEERKQYWLQLRENPRKVHKVYCTDTGKDDPPGKERMIFESTDGSKAWAVKKDRFNVEWRTYVNPPKDAAVTWPWGDRQCPKCGRWMLHQVEPINDEMRERCRCCGYKTGGDRLTADMRGYYKKLDTSGHFPDFWHTAKGQRENKKIRARMERRRLNREAEMEKDDIVRCCEFRYDDKRRKEG